MVSLVPLLTAAGILIGGNALQVTLIALRGAGEGFSPFLLGMFGTAYFAGFLVGCVTITRMMLRIGHIRAFAALAAMAAAASLLFVMLVDPWVWSFARFLSGICFAGLFTVIESWINSVAENRNRGRVLAVYRIVDICSATGAQFVIPLLGAETFAVFAVMSMMITLSLVPVSLGDRSNPEPPPDIKLDLKRAFVVSPLAAVGCMVVGINNGAFRTLGPVYAQQIGMDVSQAVTFMSFGIVGGALLQFPLGALSDKHDRRVVLVGATAAAMLFAATLSFMTSASPVVNMALVFGFSSFAMSIYSLSVAHANDHAAREEYVMVCAALLLFYAIGAVAGPTVASLLMERAGPAYFFGFIATMYAVFIVFALWRMSVRGPAPESRRKRFIGLIRTSPFMAKLARRSPGENSEV